MSQPEHRSWTIVKVLVSVVVIGGAAFYLLGGSLRRSLIYDRTVDQLSAERAELTGQQVRVGGLLVEGSHQVEQGTSNHQFVLRGADARVTVRYQGLWPDAATDGREVMVEGTLAEDGLIEAERVLARCPSRYKRRIAPDGAVGPQQ